MKKKVLIAGAGPGGLTAGMLLASYGFDVEVYEKRDIVGGRNGYFQLGEYKFDIGPTFFLMKNVLEEIFRMTGRKIEDYLDIRQIEPMYRLAFKDRTLFPSTIKEEMIKDIEKNFPGNSNSYLKYMEREKIKYDKLIPCLKVPYGKITDFFSGHFIKAIPYLDINKSLYDVLSEYFPHDDLRTSFTFQAKYIGMSPWKAPGLYTIISYIEHGGGVFHVMGGLNKLSDVMAKIIEEDGGKVYLSKEITKVIVEKGKAVGFEFKDGTQKRGDYIIINVDFANAMTKLVDEKYRRKYSNKKIKKMEYSCSTFMLYLGVKKIYDNINHHNIFFADDYKKNVYEIAESKVLSDDPSFYVQNASLIDSTLAPEEKSTIYVLVPVPNNTSGIDWNKEKDKFKDKILSLLEKKAGLKDIRKNIEVEKVFTPFDWENDMDVFNGATFNLGHGINQMLYWRPHNEFEDIKNCYLVGGGTHPGSGLPTIYESGRISAELIKKRERK